MMDYVTQKKIKTIPFGAEIPPELAKRFDHIVSSEGWTKKRAIAAAISAFIDIPEAKRSQIYKSAYESAGSGTR